MITLTSLVFGFAGLAHATVYAPGATLNPDCAMGSANCGVDILSRFIPYAGAAGNVNLNNQALSNVSAFAIGTTSTSAAAFFVSASGQSIANFASSSGQSALSVASNGTVSVNAPFAGGSWIAEPSIPAGAWNSVAYGGGAFAAVGDHATMHSSNGAAWTATSSGLYWNSVAYGSGTFAAVGDGNQAITSSDGGVTWTTHTLPENGAWQAVAYGNGTFVAVATGADNGNAQLAITSPDGATWTVRTTPGTGQWSSVAYGNGIFVAVTLDGNVMTSPNGVNWTFQSVPANQGLQSVAYGNGVFVAIPGGGTETLTSSDGVTWTAHAGALQSATWNSVAFGAGFFVAMANGMIGATSRDGANWTFQPLPQSGNWSLVYGTSFFSAVAANKAMISAGFDAAAFQVYGSGGAGIVNFESSAGQSAFYIGSDGNIAVGDGLSVSGTTTLATTSITTLYANSVGISTTSLANSLTVNGAIYNYSDASHFSVATSARVGEYPQQLIVDGKYAYVTSNYDNLGGANLYPNPFTIVDISNPLAPRQIATTTAGGASSIGLAKSGHYVYVVNNGELDHNIAAFDVSNPSAPQLLSTTTTMGTSTGANSYPGKIAISGKYAYVTVGGLSDALNIINTFDLSNPAKPVLVATTTVDSAPQAIAVSGKYAYVPNNNLSASVQDLSVLDLSNPAAPVEVASTSLLGGPGPGGVPAVAIEGNYAYVVGFSGNSLNVVDISNPLAPVFVAHTGFALSAIEIAVSGNYAYTADQDGHVSIFNIADPTHPHLITTIATTNDTQGVAVSGKYLFTANSEFNSDAGPAGTMSVIDVGGIDTNGLRAAALETGNLNVTDSAAIDDFLSVGTGLAVGQGGITSNGALAVTATNTPSYFADSVGIGTSTP
ncbi:MAG: hypothetical protein KGH93_03365, partial [Patescibacteria group bacterium]|nr:hypothetical protein [Patescibacteria group bacterium]